MEKLFRVTYPDDFDFQKKYLEVGIPAVNTIMIEEVKTLIIADRNMAGVMDIEITDLEIKKYRTLFYRPMRVPK